MVAIAEILAKVVWCFITSFLITTAILRYIIESDFKQIEEKAYERRKTRPRGF